jgi:hypothetical protein
MKVELKVKRGRIYVGGNELLRYTVCVPITEGCERINRFYTEVGEKCECFCEYDLKELCSLRSAYRLEFALTHKDDEVIAFLMRATLYSEGVKKEEYVRAHAWTVDTQKLISSRLLVKKYGDKAKKVKRSDGLFLHKGVIESLDKTDIDSIFEMKNKDNKLML